MAVKGKKNKEEIDDVVMANEAENEAKSAEESLLEEMEQDAEAAERSAEINAAEADEFDVDGISAMIEAMAMAGAAPAEPDMDLTDAVEMDSLEDLAEVESEEVFGDEE